MKCDEGYSWTNAVGTYSVQWACGSFSAPWSLKLTPDAQSIVESGVSERGMSWSLDGKQQGQQAPHLDEYPGTPFTGATQGSLTVLRSATRTS